MAAPQEKEFRFNVLTFGAGAIGTYVGGSLALAGHHVVFIEQAKSVEDLRDRDLRLGLSADKRRKATESFLVDPKNIVIVSSLEEALRYGPFDIAIFALKSFDTDKALKDIKPFAEKVPPILCLSNGVDNEPAIAQVLGEEKVIHGTVTSAVGRRAAGDIVLEKLRGLGIAATHPLSKQLLTAFNDAYLNAQPFSDADGMKWSKMLTNLLANPLSAILDMTAAEVYSHRGLYQLEIRMLRECLNVMQAKGIEVVNLPGTPVKALSFAAKLPWWISKPFLSRAAGTGRGGKMPSFHIDLHAGRGRSEVDYLHGAVVRAGEQAGVPTPVNKLLTDTLLALTRGDIPITEYACQPDKFLTQSKKG